MLSSPMLPASPHHYRALDAWRGLAALAVVPFHLLIGYRDLDIGRFLRDSYLFVDFFFLLSGFVVSYAYAERLRQPGEPARFLIRRLGRLWPLHVVTLAYVVWWRVLHGQQLPLTIKTADGFNPLYSHILLLNDVGLTTNLNWNIPAWSISAEFWTYVAFLAVAWRAPRRLMPVLAAGCVAASLYVLWRFTPPAWMENTVGFGFFRATYGFALGYLLYRLVGRGASRLAGGTAIELAALVLALAFVYVAGYRESWISLFAPFAFAPLILAYAAEEGAISSVLIRAPFQFLGRISYSIYLVHYPIIITLGPLLADLKAATGFDLTFVAAVKRAIAGDWSRLTFLAVATVAIVIAVATLTFHLIEQPGRRLANRWASRRTRPPLAAPAVDSTVA